MTVQNTSESAFQKALDAENAGEKAKAEQWLKLAVKREAEENAANINNIGPSEQAVA